MFEIHAKVPLDPDGVWTGDVSEVAAAKVIGEDGCTRLLIETGDTLVVGPGRSVWVETRGQSVYPEQVLAVIGFGGLVEEYGDPLLILHAWSVHGQGVSVDEALTVATTFSATRALLTSSEPLLPMLAHDPQPVIARLARTFLADPAFGDRSSACGRD